MTRVLRIAAVLALPLVFGGCAVVSIAGTAVGVAATATGVAVNATVGAARAVGSAVGAVAGSGEAK